MTIRSLTPAELRATCDPARLPFTTTAELDPLTEWLGQARASEAVRFGVGMRHEGYNLFAMGPTDAGKHTAVRAIIEARAAQEEAPDDALYVNNFDKPDAPKVLLLPAGRGRAFVDDMKRLVEQLRSLIPSALESDEFRVRRQAIEDELKARHESTAAEFRRHAEEKNLALAQTPSGFALVPMKGGEMVRPDAFTKLPDEERKRYESAMEEVGQELRDDLERLPRLFEELRRRIKELVRETLAVTIGHPIGELTKKYAEWPLVLAHLAAIQKDVLDNAGDFIPSAEDAHKVMELGSSRTSPFRRYEVNLLVDNAETKGSPVIYEDRPTYDNLVGRVEHIAQLGALVTDFTLIKAGTLHRANGGYLLLDARNLLLTPYAWDGLKRALSAKQIRVEPLGQALGISSAVSLVPEPVPLHVKVVLLGERRLFYLLEELDPELRSLFKVTVDIEDTIARTAENEQYFARLIAAMAKDERLLPFDRGAVAAVIERSARLAEDATQLSTHMGQLGELLRESDHWANERGAKAVSAEDVDHALSAEDRRAGRLRERVLDQIREGTLLIETSGSAVGQVNGLSVLQIGRHAFGRPGRITARVRLGRGEVVDIEREVELGGPIHSKGVLILAGFLGARYACEHPLSLSATLVFEQSYGMIEGDSASSAELYALLSALSGAAIRQSYAVTGSINQHGDVQPIGGVNEKIEGFFDVCVARGLTGDQGVVIPSANLRHLMLRRDVVDAVREGKFSVYAVDTVDDGIELLTDLPAGRRADGDASPFAEGSVNRRVEDKLIALARLRERYAEPPRPIKDERPMSASATA